MPRKKKEDAAEEVKVVQQPVAAEETPHEESGASFPNPDEPIAIEAPAEDLPEGAAPEPEDAAPEQEVPAEDGAEEPAPEPDQEEAQGEAEAVVENDVPPLAGDIGAADTLPEGYIALAPDQPDEEELTGNDLTPPREEDMGQGDGDAEENENAEEKRGGETTVSHVAAQAGMPTEDEAPAPKKAPAKKKAPVKKKTAPPTPPKKDFYASDFRELDRYLSPRQKQEWDAIYASYRSKNLLYGEVVGADPKTFDLKENGQWVRKKMFCPVVLDYRVKVLIPSTEMWMPGEERPEFVIQEMKGAKIAYVIINVDREGECAIASRRIALAAQQHYFQSVRGGHQEGEMLKCNVLTVGPKRCLVECGGYDITLTQKELSYTAIPDLREVYHPGDVLDCRLKTYDPKEGVLDISVKEVEPNPFIGADTRHPVGARRNATISGKYKGGVFCTLSDGTVVLCLYSPLHSDVNFQIGDGVVIAISTFDFERELVYGRILTKW